MNLRIEDKNNLSISTQLHPFVDSLQVFTRRYEDITLKISETLPWIEKQIDDNLLEARELLNFLFSTASEEKAFGVKREISKFHNQLDAILSTMTEMNSTDKRILAELKDSIEISNNTADEMARIYDISENLKVYAINSIVNSQKAGDRGRGYQVISTEFIKSSEEIATGTRKISAISNQIQNEINTFLDTIAELESFSKEYVNSISSDSQDILTKANRSIRNFSEILNDLLNRIEHSKSPTYQIMVELQKQDIIHQQLTHLVKNIDDILVILENNSKKLDFPTETMTENERYETRSLYTLMNFLLENTEHQIARISTEFIEMIEHLEEAFSQMNNSILDINSDKSEFSSIIVPDGAGSVKRTLEVDDSDSVIGYIFDAPCILIREMSENIHNLQEQKRNILKLFFILEKKIEIKKNSAQTFLPVIDSIKNLLLMSRIEQARYNLDFSIAGSDKEIGFFYNSFEDLTSIITDIEKAHLLVIDNSKKTRESFAEQEILYSGMKRDFTESVDVLQNTKDIFMEHFKTVMDITGILVDEISNYTGFLNELRKMNEEIINDMAVCGDIKDKINKRLVDLGGILPLHECHFKDLIYQEIVQKCTVAQERETISENFSDFEIETSGDNGITLF